MLRKWNKYFDWGIVWKWYRPIAENDIGLLQKRGEINNLSSSKTPAPTFTLVINWPCCRPLLKHDRDHDNIDQAPTWWVYNNCIRCALHLVTDAARSLHRWMMASGHHATQTSLLIFCLNVYIREANFLKYMLKIIISLVCRPYSLLFLYIKQVTYLSKNKCTNFVAWA